MVFRLFISEEAMTESTGNLNLKKFDLLMKTETNLCLNMLTTQDWLKLKILTI